jgi:hypothetical protein
VVEANWRAPKAARRFWRQHAGAGKRLGPDPSRDHHESQTRGNHRVPNKTIKSQADHAHDKSWAKPLGRGQILSVELNDSYPS